MQHLDPCCGRRPGVQVLDHIIILLAATVTSDSIGHNIIHHVGSSISFVVAVCITGLAGQVVPVSLTTYPFARLADIVVHISRARAGHGNLSPQWHILRGVATCSAHSSHSTT